MNNSLFTKKIPQLLFYAISAISIFLAGCSDDEGQTQATANWSAGDHVAFAAEGLSFNMVFVPGKSFKTGVDDSGADSVADSYLIGETEVTYALWNVVYNWATKRTLFPYFFQNEGLCGSSGSGSIMQPVTEINWRDAMVWTNAATEWFNEKFGSSYTCAYCVNGWPILDSRDSNATQCDNAVADEAATGFRLLSSNEWELAARYISDLNNNGDIQDSREYYPGDHASGADLAYNILFCVGNNCDIDNDGDIDASGDVAVFSTTSTAVVKSKNPNTLGIYDMSGNVYEWCFDSYPNNMVSTRVLRGNCWFDPADYLEVGDWENIVMDAKFDYIGFRIAMTK